MNIGKYYDTRTSSPKDISIFHSLCNCYGNSNKPRGAYYCTLHTLTMIRYTMYERFVDRIHPETGTFHTPTKISCPFHLHACWLSFLHFCYECAPFFINCAQWKLVLYVFALSHIVHIRIFSFIYVLIRLFVHIFLFSSSLWTI